MHELSLAQSICDTVLSYARADQKIVTVVVECGPLSGVVPESLSYCFTIVAPMVGLGEAKLDLRLLRAEGVCPACGRKIDVKSMWDGCPACGHAPITVAGGREFRIKEIEVVDRPAAAP